MKVSHGFRVQYVKRMLTSWGYSRNMEIYKKWTLSSMNKGEGSSVYGLPLTSMRKLNKQSLSCTSFFTKILGSKKHKISKDFVNRCRPAPINEPAMVIYDLSQIPLAYGIDKVLLFTFQL